jgi:hypothetical protein
MSGVRRLAAKDRKGTSMPTNADMRSKGVKGK